MPKLKIDKSLVKRILVITLSNAGDIIMTTPVIGALSKEFPDARIDAMVGPNGKEVFDHDPRIFKLIIYDKHIPIAQKRRLQLKLKKLKYDLVVDLRNTIFPLLIGPRYRTATIHGTVKEAVHKRAEHLGRLASLGITNADEPYHLFVPPADYAYVEQLLRDNGISSPIVVVNVGARSHLKRWTSDGFADVCDRLINECKASVIFIGLEEDREPVDKVIGKVKGRYYDFVNKTNIRQLAALLKKADLLITNDSAPLHVGCAVGAKVLALFGPTDPKKYGPTGEFDTVINKKLHCSPCETAECAYNYECMKLVSPDEVFDAARMMIEGYE